MRLSGQEWALESGLIFLSCFLPCSPPTPFMPFTSTLPLPSLYSVLGFSIWSIR